MKIHRALVDFASRFVPERFRADWKQEWNAEFHHHERRSGRGLTRRSLGAFRDALAMQPRRLEEEIFQDLRYGLRMFARNKALTLTAVLSLAVGIGANTALFSVVDAVMLKKLPVTNPDELVLFQWSGPRPPNTAITTDRPVPPSDAGDTFSYPAFERFRDNTHTLSDIFAFAKIYSASLMVDGQVEVGTGEYVSGGFFSGLDVSPALGRTITNADDRLSASPVAMISHRFWQNRLSAQSNALGKTLSVNGSPFTIVGVTPRSFSGTLQVDESPDIYIPISFQPMAEPSFTLLSRPNEWWVWVMGRLRPGLTFEQVRGDLESVFREIASIGLPVPASEMEGKPALRLSSVSGSRGLVDHRESYAASLMILMTLVGLVLLIACTNVANLLLARCMTRRNEIGIRRSMGASRLRLVRQLMTESGLLAGCGAVCGVAVAYFAKDLLLRWGPWTSSTASLSPVLDSRTLGFSLAISVMTGLIFGTAPALNTTRRSLQSNMQGRSRTAIGQRSYFGKGLLIVQVALSVVLLISAGLFVRTVHNLQGTVSIDTQNVMQFDIDPNLSNHNQTKASTVFTEMIERIRGLPGVKSATFSGGSGFRTVVDPAAGGRYSVSVASVGPDFFEMMGIPVVMGRAFAPFDDQNAPKRVIVNEAFVRRLFPSEAPVGKLYNGAEIVGVVRDVKYVRLREEIMPTVYSPYRQGRNSPMTFRVRTDGSSKTAFSSVREAVRQVDASLPISNVRTLAEQIDQSLSRERMFAAFSAFFGLLALALTCVGFYGAMTYALTRRTNEMGIRMALGARRFDVLRLIMSEALTLVIIGSAIGIIAALASVRFVANILFGLAPNDAASFVLAVGLMILIAAFAAFIPARKASRLDPSAALRHE